MFGSLISGGMSLLGGLIGQSQQSKQLKSQQNLQREFAQNQLQWKAQDAEKAGISKLFAMGAPTTSYAPVSVGASPLGTSVADAGQQIGRAMEAQAGPAGRVANAQLQLIQAQADGQKIDNVIKQQGLASSLALRNQPGTPPAVHGEDVTAHIPGQGDSEIKLQKKMAPGQAGQLHRSFGVAPEIDMYRTAKGFSPEVPQELGEAQESQPLSAMQWFLRNKIMPTFDHTRRTPPYAAPQGSYWRYNPLLSEYTLHALRPGIRFNRQDRRR